MDDLHVTPAESFPTIAKVVAVRLPMKTIKDFLAWLIRENPGLSLDDVWEHADGLLYSYYNVDVEELRKEVAQRNASGNRV